MTNETNTKGNEMTQRKLTDDEKENLIQARWYLRMVTGFASQPAYFGFAISDLDAMADNGTTDGRPYVEPEPEIVIDDQWAAVWPRRWVMVRDYEDESWDGPYRLLGVSGDQGDYPFSIDGNQFNQARPATPEEIATVEK
jgi:hypothetical protein